MNDEIFSYYSEWYVPIGTPITAANHVVGEVIDCITAIEKDSLKIRYLVSCVMFDKYRQNLLNELTLGKSVSFSCEVDDEVNNTCE